MGVLLIKQYSGGFKLNENKLKAKDFITIGIFSALIIAVEFACGMLGFIHPYIVAAYVVLIPLVGSIPIMLFYSKIEKFGMLTIMSVLLAIVMFVTGMGWLGGPLIIAAGFIADLLAKKENYKSFKLIAISHEVFCLWICANYFPVIVNCKGLLTQWHCPADKNSVPQFVRHLLQMPKYCYSINLLLDLITST